MSSNQFLRVDYDFLAVLPKIGGSAAKVYLALLSRRNRKTGQCNPSIPTIQKDTGIGWTRTVHTAIRELERAGVVQVHRRKADRAANQYTLLGPVGSAEKPTYPSPSSAENPHHSSDEKPPYPSADNPHYLGAGSAENPTLGSAENPHSNQMKELDSKNTDNASASAVVVMKMKTRSGEWALTQDRLDQYRAAYPTIDVLAEMRKAQLWLDDSPSKRKTDGGMPKFLTSWLSRAESHPPGRDGRTQTPDTAWTVASLWGEVLRNRVRQATTADGQTIDLSTATGYTDRAILRDGEPILTFEQVREGVVVR